MRSLVSLCLAGLTGLLAVGCDEPPEIQRVLLSRTSLLDGESAVVGVVVHDQTGLDDIVGVQLFSDDMGYWFGALTEISDGVFETTIDWSRMNEQQAIYFDFPIRRGFKLVAEDNEGGTSVGAITLELRCAAGDHACDGHCYPIAVNCGDV